MEEAKTPDSNLSVEWALLPWRKLEQHQYRLQKRIFKASERGDLQTVHKLQKLLMKSRSARLLAVRRVTQDNQGKKTAGGDGVKSVPPTGRLAMVEAIHPKHLSKRKPKPLRRVWIPKPGKTEQGFPLCMREHARHWPKLSWNEAKFEANSYGGAVPTMQSEQSSTIAEPRVNTYWTRISRGASTTAPMKRS